MTSDPISLEEAMACLGIANEKMRMIRNMAQVIPHMPTKEDIQFVLETMRDELKEGNDRINQIVGD